MKESEFYNTVNARIASNLNLKEEAVTMRSSNEKARSSLESDIKEFLENGGKIEKVPTGVSGMSGENYGNRRLNYSN